MDRPHLFRKTGYETLSFAGRPIGQSVLDFWRWSVSDLVSNATRGRFAEFIVGAALGVDFARVRDEWKAWDLETPSGIRVEVKSAAYRQSWHQEKPSKISFSIKAAHAWDSDTSLVGETRERASDVYVFCLLEHHDPATIDPLVLDQWRFWVVATKAIDEYMRSAHSITLPSLRGLVEHRPDAAAGPLTYPELAGAVLRHPKKAAQTVSTPPWPPVKPHKPRARTV